MRQSVQGFGYQNTSRKNWTRWQGHLSHFHQFEMKGCHKQLINMLLCFILNSQYCHSVMFLYVSIGKWTGMPGNAVNTNNAAWFKLSINIRDIFNLNKIVKIIMDGTSLPFPKKQWPVNFIQQKKLQIQINIQDDFLIKIGNAYTFSNDWTHKGFIWLLD